MRDVKKEDTEKGQKKKEREREKKERARNVTGIFLFFISFLFAIIT